MSKRTATQISESTQYISEYIKKGDTLYIIGRTVAKSGMSATFSVYSYDEGRLANITHHVAHIAGYTLVRDSNTGANALRVNGCGFDRYHDIAYNLGHALHQDGDAFSYQSL